jgi:hypothetical protein
VDVSKFIQAPGLSAYVGISWGTGSNLSGTLDSAIPTSGLYAPSFYGGEMYMQQALVRQKLTMLVGRLAPANAFAALPAFANYVNCGIDPNPFSLGTNDLAFYWSANRNGMGRVGARGTSIMPLGIVDQRRSQHEEPCGVTGGLRAA